MKFDGAGVALVSLSSTDGRLLTEQTAELAGTLAGLANLKRMIAARFSTSAAVRRHGASRHGVSR